MNDLRDPQSPQSGGLSVGGPGGIRIDGGQVQAGGFMVSGGSPAPYGAPYGQTAPGGPMQRSPERSLAELGAASSMALRHSGLLSMGLAFAAVLLLSGAAVVISVLALPWLLITVPSLLAAGLLGGAVVVASRGRNRRFTAGIEPETERRLLDLAEASRGRLTVTAAARGLGLPLAEAEQALGALARTGHVTVDNDAASGVIVYVFPEIEAGLGAAGTPRRSLP